MFTKKLFTAAALLLAVALVATLSSCGKLPSQAGWLADTTAVIPTTTDAITTDALTTAPDSGTSGSASEVYSSPLDENGRYRLSALDYVTLPDPLTVTVPAGVHTVSQYALDAQLGYLLSSFADSSIKLDRAVRAGDTVNIDYVGSVDGTEFEGGSTKGAGTDVIIGYTTYIDDFLDQLIGHKPGETVNVEVTFPENYSKAELRGKDAVFVTVINYICSVPELTDDFVEANFYENFGCKTKDTLLSYIETALRENSITNYLNSLIDSGFAVSSVPQELVDHQTDLMLQYYLSYAETYSVPLDELLQSSLGMTEEELIASSAGELAAMARQCLVLQALAEKNGTLIGDAEMKLYFADNFGSEDYSEYADYYGLPYLKLIVQNEMVMAYLRQIAILG